MDNFSLPFTVGHHDQNRPLPVTAETVASAHATGYDLVTSPITSSYFHSRILTLLSSTLSDSASTLDDITSSQNASPITVTPLDPDDTPLAPDELMSQVLGLSASWIDIGSPDPIIADVSKQILRLELAYAAFCGLSYVLIPGPRLSGGNANSRSIITQYARVILDALSQGPFMTIYIWLPMIDHPENDKGQMGDLASFVRPQYLDEGQGDSRTLDLFGTWQAWDIIRSMCKYSTRLCVGKNNQTSFKLGDLVKLTVEALSLPRLLPSTSIQSRWFSEPVRILTLESEIFVKNPKGYPVLSKAHQALIFRFTQLKQPATWFLLCGVGPVPTSSAVNFTPSDPNVFPSLAEASAVPQIKDQTPHLSYMRNLQTKRPARSPVDTFGAGYQDYLQAPLQPLTVNLESITYEVFEKDPIKYEWYERAVARALHDWVEQGKPTSNPDGRVVVAVVGAGRGPLVTRALQASEAVGVEIDMWALEKNPNAFVLLQRRNELVWKRKVNLVKSDMRTWRGPVRMADASQIRKSYNLDPDEEQADTSAPAFTGSSETDATYLLATATHLPTTYKIDILISELLGSFADNELSPECLDGVQHLLNPTHGISIPSSYTAHITPIAAPKLHADISLGMVNVNPHAAEVPYVVMLNAIDYLSTTTTPTTTVSPHSSDQSGKDAAAPNTNSETRQQNQHQSQSQSQSWSKIAKGKSTTADSNTSQQAQQQPTPTPIIKQTWSFQHPNPSLFLSTQPHSTPSQPSSTTTLTTTPTNTHNTRHTLQKFPIPHRGTCHGLAGYFETILYPSVELSTEPNTMPHKSKDMISWFPIFFPLKTPLYCPDKSLLEFQMWRQTDDRKVWYEWIVDLYVDFPSTTTTTTTYKNKRVRIGGSELHSSEKEGCLM